MTLNVAVDLLKAIDDKLDRLSNSERRVAETVLKEPHAVIDMSISKIAQLAGVSEPTVLRFCRSFQCEGFREFKLKLAQGLAVGKYYVHRSIEAEDDAETYIQKVGNFSVEVLSNVVKKLDTAQVEKAVDMLSRASKIEFWGFGASAVVAADAHHKFFRLGIPCSAYSDSHMQCMSASIQSKDTVVVAFSHTGRAKELIENIALARKTGGTVIGVTTPNSLMDKECSHVVGVELDEDTDIFSPMVSRLAHLMLLDMLVVGVSLQKGQQVTDQLKRQKEALVHKRY